NPKSLRHLFITKKGVDNETTKWSEFIKDYNFNLNDHLGKVDVVVEVLSRKPFLRDSSFICEITLKSMKLDLLKITSDMMGENRQEITHDKMIDVRIRIDEVTRFHNKIHVLYVTKLRKLIIQTELSSGLRVWLGVARTYQNLREMIA
ncbi:hypothetical protein CR513_56341, partial [Mucuna pruriens]